MKGRLSIIVFFATIFHVNAQDYWQQRDSVNGPPRTTCAAFVLNDDAYVVTGLDVYGFKRSMVSYDISQDDWDDELSLGGDFGDGLNRGSAIAFNVGGFGFCGLGTGSVEYFKDLWRFDAVTNTWTQMADFEGTARREAIAFSIDNYAYVGTGQDENGLTNDFWRYDFTVNDWQQMADFPGSARKDAVGFSMIGQGYVGTGTDINGFTNDFYAYYPLLDEWQQKADFPGTPRHGAIGFGLFPTAFLGLGEDNTFTFKNDIWEYNYFGDSWTQRSNFPGEARAQAISVVVENRAFIGTGYNGDFHDDFYEYVPMLSVENKTIDVLNLYPNPVSSNFIVSYGNGAIESINIYNQLGQNISNQFVIEKKSQIFAVSLNNELNPGIYFCVLKIDDYLCTKSFTVQ